MKKILLSAFLMFSLAGFAQALIIEDPAVLHLGDPPNTGAYLYNKEVIAASPAAVQIYFNSGGGPRAG